MADTTAGSAAYEAVADTVYRLADAIDRADLDQVEALFGDAEFSMAGGRPVAGGAAFRRLLAGGMVLHDGSPRTAHLLTNLAVAVDPDDPAVARSSVCVTVLQAVPPDFPLQVILTGRYLDRFVRSAAGDGAWRLAERVMHVDLVGDTSRHSIHDLRTT